MKWGILTIDTPSSNRGNRFIEYSVRTLLGLPPPSVSVPMFSVPTSDNIDNLNSCDFVILPGSTILADGKKQGEAMESLQHVSVPKFCIAAGSWEPQYKLNKRILPCLTEPIGIRDPVTYNQVLKLGYKCIFTGCPTAYLDKLSVTSKKFAVVGFARKWSAWQGAYFSSLQGPLVAAVQEERAELSAGKKLASSVFTYEDPCEVVTKYAESTMVITGRLHGVLPAMSQEKPVVFFGDAADSRFSLLTRLGIKINKIGSDWRKFTVNYPKEYTPKVAALKRNFLSWKSQTTDKFV